MPKENKKKKSKVIKQKQRQKQQISIVINSNNRSKRTTVPRPPPPPPPQAPRNNPPVVNIMGDSRPQTQVNPSGNFSGIGQQNRIFANDSALEQRLSRLLKFENDQSANATPALSNTKVLPPQPPPRATSPYAVKFKAPPTNPIKAPPTNPVMNLDFFNTRRKQYEDAQALKIQDDEEKQQETDDIDETKSTPSLMERGIERARKFFTPKTNIHAQVSPTENRLEDVYIKEEEEEPEPASATASTSPVSSSQQLVLNNDNLGELVKPWKAMKRIEKREWALTNRGNGAEYVGNTEDEIDAMLVGQLNDIYANVILARRQTLQNAKQI